MTPAPPVWEQFLPFALIIVIFYFLIIRPQGKRLKDHQKLLQSLKKGDEVLTSGGILGVVDGITEKFVTLRIDDDVKIKILKNQVSSLASESK